MEYSINGPYPLNEETAQRLPSCLKDILRRSLWSFSTAASTHSLRKNVFKNSVGNQVCCGSLRTRGCHCSLGPHPFLAPCTILSVKCHKRAWEVGQPSSEPAVGPPHYSWGTGCMEHIPVSVWDGCWAHDHPIVEPVSSLVSPEERLLWALPVVDFIRSLWMSLPLVLTGTQTSTGEVSFFSFPF